MTRSRENTVEFHPDDQPWYRGPYFILTVTLLLCTIAFPLGSRLIGTNVMQVMITALLFASMYAVIERKWLFRSLLIVIFPIILSNWFVDPNESHPYLNWLTALATDTFLVTVLVVVFADIVMRKRVTADLIFGSVAVYLLFGVVVALIFHLINSIDPGSVIASVGDAETVAERRDEFSEVLYFSFVTLTSVGYGDLTPLESPARSVAMLEGIIGQLYIAILVAKLVGVYTAQSLTDAGR